MTIDRFKKLGPILSPGQFKTLVSLDLEGPAKQVFFESKAGVAVREYEWIPAIERKRFNRPWWQRCLGWIYRPWRKPRIVETMPCYVVAGAVWIHPDNIEALRRAIDNRNQGESLNDKVYND